MRLATAVATPKRILLLRFAREGTKVPIRTHHSSAPAFRRGPSGSASATPSAPGTERTWAAKRAGHRRWGGCRKECHRRTACVRCGRVCRRPAGARHRTVGLPCVAGAAPSPRPTALRGGLQPMSLYCASHTLAARRSIFAQGTPGDPPRRRQFQLPDPQAAVTVRRGSMDPWHPQSTPC